MPQKISALANLAKRSSVVIAALLIPAIASAQNCALCYTQAAGSSQRFIAALRSGILLLMVPPMAISIAIAVMAYRKRNQFSED